MLFVGNIKTIHANEFPHRKEVERDMVFPPILILEFKQPARSPITECDTRNPSEIRVQIIKLANKISNGDSRHVYIGGSSHSIDRVAPVIHGNGRGCDKDGSGKRAVKKPGYS